MWFIFTDKYFPYTISTVSKVLGEDCIIIQNSEIGNSIHTSVEITNNHFKCCLIIDNEKHTLTSNDFIWLYRRPYSFKGDDTTDLEKYQESEHNCAVQGFMQNCAAKKINAYSCHNKLMNMNVFSVLYTFLQDNQQLVMPVINVTHGPPPVNQFAKWPIDDVNKNGFFYFSLSDKSLGNLQLVIALGEHILVYEIKDNMPLFIADVNKNLKTEIQQLKNKLNKDYLELIIIKSSDNYPVFYVKDDPTYLEYLLSNGCMEFEEILHNYVTANTIITNKASLYI